MMFEKTLPFTEFAESTQFKFKVMVRQDNSGIFSNNKLQDNFKQTVQYLHLLVCRRGNKK